MKNAPKKYTRKEWKRLKNTLETSKKKLKITLETSGEDVTKNTCTMKYVSNDWYVQVVTGNHHGYRQTMCKMNL